MNTKTIKAIILLTFLCKDVSSNFCSETVTSGPYHLKPNPPVDLKVKQVELILKRTSLSEKDVHGIFAYRSYWKSYCFQGGPMDGNTGCIEGLVHMKPSLEEASRWVKTGKCIVGKDYVDAWGSDAQICDSDNKMNTEYGHKELQKRSTNNRFWYHMCNKSWRCGYHEIQLPATLEKGHLMVPLANGTLTNATTGKFFETQDSISYITTLPSVKTEEIRADCLENFDTKKYYCTDPDTRLHFELSEMEMTCDRLACYFIRAAPLLSSTEDFLRPGYWQSASIRDVQHLATYLQELQYGQQMNVIRLQNQLYHIENLFLKLTESLAKIDDRLIGYLLGQPMQTKFLSNDKFLVSPCISKPADSNCVGNQIFQDGRWILNSNPGNCIKLTKSQNITIFNNFTLWLPNLDEIDMQGTASELTGWSYFATAKADLDDTMRYTKQGGPHSSIQDLVDWPKGALNNLVHSFGLGIFGSYIFCIAIALIVWIVIKKF